MLKYGLVVLGLCASSGVGCAQDDSQLFSVDQLSRLAEGMRYLVACPSEENWHQPNTMLGNCIGGPAGAPEQASGGGN